MISVVVPCYRVGEKIFEVLAAIGPECQAVFVVDDACPEKVAEAVKARVDDPRVKVIRHKANQGVGGATLSGYRAAIEGGATVIVKLDGDAQMDPALIPLLAQPILDGEADYVKGNRFYDLETVKSMPALRTIGNAFLSFVSKLSSGYWDLFDPTNGYTAIHAGLARRLPFTKLHRGYFFESDLLFRLNVMRAVVLDVPMSARYGDEHSSLRIHRIVGPFLWGHSRNTLKRIVYNYFLRNFSVASLELVAGTLLLSFGALFGAFHWYESVQSGVPATSGTVMLAALPFLVGVELLLAFLGYDMQNIPRRPLQRHLTGESETPAPGRTQP